MADWMASISGLIRQPDDVLLHRGYAWADEPYPQARLLNEAMLRVKTEWVWMVNVDDLALPGGLDQIDVQSCDVWLAGFRRSSGREYVPRAMENDAYLASMTNPYPSMSPFRTELWRMAGGFPVIGHEDWGFWRRCARIGARFESSGRVHAIYREHKQQRSIVDVGEQSRDQHFQEVLADTVGA